MLGQPSTVEEPRRRLRVCLAEDDDELRELLATALRHSGFDVVVVSDGRRLVECVEGLVRRGRAAPDVIVSDVNMPGGSGLDAIARLRHEGIDVPVVLITAHSASEVSAGARDLGAAAFLRKPFGVHDLRTTLRAVTHPRSSTPRRHA